MATKRKGGKRRSKRTTPKTRTITKYKTRTRTLIKKVRVKARRKARRIASAVATTSRSVRRSVRRRVSGMSTNKKELAIQAAFVGGGFVAGMAISNLAPLPAFIRDSKFKGLGFVLLGILGAAKLRSSRGRAACVGLAAYGAVATAKAFIPQLQALGAADTRSSMLIGGSVRQSMIGASPANAESRRHSPVVITTP